MLDRIKRAIEAKIPFGDAREESTDPGNLLSWWHGEFTQEEQRYVENKIDVRSITHPDLSQGFTGSLALDATWFLTGDDILLARRIMAKSVERQESETGATIDRHFIYDCMIQVYYRDRNRDENALTLAVEACEKQIALAPQVIREQPKDWEGELPTHLGFQQLAIVRERDRDYKDAIHLSEVALQQGWAGDWEKRIARCRRKNNRRT